MHADSGISTHDRSHADRAGSSDKAEVFHHFALASQDLMVLFGHHHCQHEYRNYKAQASWAIWHQNGNLHAIWHKKISLLTRMFLTLRIRSLPGNIDMNVQLQVQWLEHSCV